MNKTFKTILTVLIVFVAALSLGACRGNVQEPDPDASLAPKVSEDAGQ